jgi:(R,R)-butanediol dehydrogenase/meso-butanediol dehydrogenase/diacetyl reductase
MRAALFHGPDRPITIEQIDDPRPAPGQVVLKVCRCGICGSDLSMTAPGAVCYPLGEFGHELSGEIVELGKGVPTHLRVGDRVACPPTFGCGTCAGCRNGNPIFCTGAATRSAGFSEFTTADARVVVPLPAGLSFADGALVEPMACGLHALKMAWMMGGERVLVLGAGAMALTLIFWARRLGAGRIVALSRSAHRRDLLLEMGADAVHTFEEADPAFLAEALGGPADIVGECVGKEGLLAKSIELVRREGTVISLGMCMQGEPVIPAICAFKEVRLLFPIGWSQAEYVDTLKAFDAGDIRPDRMVSQVIPLGDLPAMLDQLRAGAKTLKVQVDPSL